MMRTFTVRVRTQDHSFRYTALGIHSFDVHAAALDLFDEPCSVVVIAL